MSDKITEDIKKDENLSSLSNNTLSKRARKRQERDKRFHENLESFKMFKRQKRKERREKRRILNIQIIKKPIRLMNCDSASKVKVVIHCGYSQLMSEKLNKSLVYQLRECYAMNRRAKHPVQLYFTGIDTTYKAILSEICQNYEKWDVNCIQDSYMNIFNHDNMIYLTSESTNILNKIDESKIYIIGGLIDRNSHKGLCYKEAVDNKIYHQCLPLNQYFKLKQSKVLTTNQVFQIISLMVDNGNNVCDALTKVVPKRKIDENLTNISHYTTDII